MATIPSGSTPPPCLAEGDHVWHGVVVLDANQRPVRPKPVMIVGHGQHLVAVADLADGRR